MKLLRWLGAGALIASPAAATFWVTRDQFMAYEAVAHASAESKWTLMTGGFRSQALDDIPDRFVELLLEQPAPASPVRTRRWFPHTLLWAPRVATDADGRATLDIPVPDALTTWQLLGLSLSADGSPSGEELRLRATAPVSIDLRLPELLRMGDRVEVPILVHNTSAEELSTELRVGDRSRALRVAAGESAVAFAELRAAAQGTVRLRADLPGVDAIERVAAVRPVGVRSVERVDGGAAWSPPPGATAAEARLVLSAGPLAALDRALTVTEGTDLADLALSWRLGNLDLPEGYATNRRRQRMRATQGLRAWVQPSGDRDRDFDRALGRTRYQEGLLFQVQNTAALPSPTGGLPEFRDWLIDHQLDDGSWTVPAGAPLSQLLSTTAWMVRLLDDDRARLRASALFERHAGRIADPFTAAMVLASGAVEGEQAEALRALVRAGGSGGIRPDGAPARAIDQISAAILGLEDLDRGPALLAAIDPDTGFGDGWSGLLALDALAMLPAGGPTTATLRLDGAPAASLTTDSAMVEQSVPLDPGRPHDLSVLADGLGAWRLELASWTAPPPPELSLTVAHEAAVVGQLTWVRVSMDVPVSLPISLRHALPAGVDLLAETVEADGAEARLTGDRVEIPAGHAAQVELRYAVLPSLAGELWSDGVEVRAGETVTRTAPAVWRITRLSAVPQGGASARGPGGSSPW